jgi:Flp pilus assembly protein TadD
MARVAAQRTSHRPRRNSSNATGLIAARHSRFILLIVLLGTVSFLPAAAGPFVFDDVQGIQHNPSIQQGLSWTVFDPPRNSSVAGRPVVNLTLALNQEINDALGIDLRTAAAPIGFHLVNIALHVVTALLLFGVVRRTLELAQRPTRLEPQVFAGLVACLWAVHAIHTSAVNYVIQRSELLVSAFVLATLYAFVRAYQTESDRARVRWLTVSVVACALGMLSKEVMIGAPLIVLLFDRALMSPSWRAIWESRKRWYYAALLASGAIIVAFVAAGVRSRSVGASADMSVFEYLYSQGWAIPRYLRLLIWPSGLTFDYGDAPVTGWMPGIGLVILALFAAVVIWAWAKGRFLPLALLGATFFILLAPSSSVVPIHTEIAAERRVYLASATVIILAMLGLDVMMRRRQQTWSTPWKFATGALVATLATTTFIRSSTFASAERLYGDVVQKAPGNARGYIGLGLALFASDEPRFAEATALFQQAVSVDPHNFAGWYGLGIAKYAQGRAAEASEAFRSALRAEPGHLDATAGLTQSLIATGAVDSAVVHLRELPSPHPELLHAMGVALVDRGRGREAVPYLQTSVQMTRRPEVMTTLARALAQSGDSASARAMMDSARQRGP